MNKASTAASFFFFLLLTFLLSLPGMAQDDFLPIPRQYQMILKVLAFDNDLHKRGEIRLGIVYEKDYSSSVQVKNELVKIMNASAPQHVQGIPVSFKVIELQSAWALTRAIDVNKINIIYIAPMSREELRLVLRVCNQNKIPTFTGMSAFVKLGVAVGFKRLPRRITILVNRAAARDQRFNLSSRLLNLAEISGILPKKRKPGEH